MALTDATSAHDVSLNTDLYEFTMAQGYWDAGLVDMQSCFTVFFRSNPFDGGYAIACGMSQLAAFEQLVPVAARAFVRLFLF